MLSYPKESCGIFGIYGHPDAVNLTCLGLYALQHRGQESAGIVVSDGKNVSEHKGMGLVAEVFKPDAIKKLSGYLGIGHVRYSTTGSPSLKNAQPFLVDCSLGKVAVAHNGNLVNTSELRGLLEKSGSIFQTTMDSELLIHLMAHSRMSDFGKSLMHALNQVKGSYSLVFLREDQIIGVRDPFGFRPLCMGKLDGATILASETCALDLLHARFEREIEPGEIIAIDKKGVHSFKPFPDRRLCFCIFELIYFARPDSDIFGGNVYLARKELGRRLAREYPIEADMVVAIPD